MSKKEEERALVFAQATLDQCWAQMELCFPFVLDISQNGWPEQPSAPHLELAQRMAALVALELSTRVVQREQYLRVKAEKHKEKGLAKMTFKAVSGEVVFLCPEEEVRSLSNGPIKLTSKPQDAKIRIKGFRQVDDKLAVIFPNGDIEQVPSSEVEFE